MNGVYKLVCIYHGNCQDGFAAATVVRKFFQNSQAYDVEFVAGVYSNDPPEIEQGSLVVFVDFSYKKPVMLKLLDRASGILVLDHHKTAMEDLRDDPRIYSGKQPACWRNFRDYVGSDIANSHSFVYPVFDMQRSGAGLTWDFFFGHPRPDLINHIEDRDLWRFNLPYTREIAAALFSFDYDFETYQTFMLGRTAALVQDGIAIERKQRKDVAELVKVCKRPMLIGGYIVPGASLPYILTSDAGVLMAQGEPFAACYWDTPDGRVFSLRSAEVTGLDVSNIAKQYGGGGHKHAAGFRIPLERIPEFEVPKNVCKAYESSGSTAET